MTLPPGTVIVNADDFGQSSLVNRAIVTCFREQLISSATIMANMPAFDEACELALTNRLTRRIGIHLNLTEGRPLLPEVRDNSTLCDSSGYFRRTRPRLLSKSDRAHIAAEISAQIAKCRTAGLPLTHADSHQHVHNEPMVLLAMQPILKKCGIRFLRISRNMDALPLTSAKSVAKACFNQVIAAWSLRGTDYFGTVENFEDFRTNGRLQGASLEILTHPSFDQDGVLIDHLDGQPLADRLSHAFRDFRLSAYQSDSFPVSSQERAA